MTKKKAESVIKKGKTEPYPFIHDPKRAISEEDNFIIYDYLHKILCILNGKYQDVAELEAENIADIMDYHWEVLYNDKLYEYWDKQKEKQIERYCIEFDESVPKSCLELGDCGCRIKTPLFSEELNPNKKGVHICESIEEIYKFKVGKKYRITVEEIE